MLYSVYVSHLPCDTTREQLLELFDACGNVKDAFINTPAAGTPSAYTYGFVRFSQPETVLSVVKEGGWMLRGSALKVEIASETKEALRLAMKGSYSSSKIMKRDNQVRSRVKEAVNIINQELDIINGDALMDANRVMDQIEIVSSKLVQKQTGTPFSKISLTLEELCKMIDEGAFPERHSPVSKESSIRVMEAAKELLLETQNHLLASIAKDQEEKRQQLRAETGVEHPVTPAFLPRHFQQLLRAVGLEEEREPGRDPGQVMHLRKQKGNSVQKLGNNFVFKAGSTCSEEPPPHIEAIIPFQSGQHACNARTPIQTPKNMSSGQKLAGLIQLKGSRSKLLEESECGDRLSRQDDARSEGKSQHNTHCSVLSPRTTPGLFGRKHNSVPFSDNKRSVSRGSPPSAARQNWSLSSKDTTIQDTQASLSPDELRTTPPPSFLSSQYSSPGSSSPIATTSSSPSTVEATRAFPTPSAPPESLSGCRKMVSFGRGRGAILSALLASRTSQTEQKNSVSGGVDVCALAAVGCGQNRRAGQTTEMCMTGITGRGHTPPSSRASDVSNDKDQTQTSVGESVNVNLPSALGCGQKYPVNASAVPTTSPCKGRGQALMALLNLKR